MMLPSRLSAASGAIFFAHAVDLSVVQIRIGLTIGSLTGPLMTVVVDCSTSVVAAIGGPLHA